MSVFSPRFPRTGLRSWLVLPLLALSVQGALAQQPDWTPVAELVVGGIGEQDPDRVAEALSRCTALNISLSGMTALDAPAMSAAYREEALKLMQSGIRIRTRMEAARTGLEPDIQALSEQAAAEVETMVGQYNGWFEDNYALNGSYLQDDNAMDVEMSGCHLAARFTAANGGP